MNRNEYLRHPAVIKEIGNPARKAAIQKQRKGDTHENDKLFLANRGGS